VQIVNLYTGLSQDLLLVGTLQLAFPLIKQRGIVVGVLLLCPDMFLRVRLQFQLGLLADEFVKVIPSCRCVGVAQQRFIHKSG